MCLLSVLVLFTLKALASGTCGDSTSLQNHTIVPVLSSFHKKINFVFTGKRRTANPAGWEEYDGSIHDAERGYGWLADLSRHGRDRGAKAAITLSDGTRTSPEDIGRLELADWQGPHQENQPIVFRIDLPNGWYRISCTSVQAGSDESCAVGAQQAGNLLAAVGLATGQQVKHLQTRFLMAVMFVTQALLERDYLFVNRRDGVVHRVPSRQA
jgi:hypothetical protein